MGTIKNRASGIILEDSSMLCACLGKDGDLQYTAETIHDSVMAAKYASCRHVIAGLSASHMIFRRTKLPFTRLEQIREILPQEAQDSFINMPVEPHFALQMRINKEQARVLYAGTAAQYLRDALRQLADIGINPDCLVVAELGALPLLLRQDMLSSSGRNMVIDSSGALTTVYIVEDGEIITIRLQAQGADNRQDVGREELRWLIEDSNRHYPCTRFIYLGPESQVNLLEPAINGETVIPNLEQLAPGLKNWEHLRVAGLALAADNRQGRELLDFRWGQFGRYDAWRPWLRPWRQTMAAVFAFLCIGLFLQALTYQRDSQEYKQLRQSISQVFHRALPGAPVMIDPVGQLRQVLNSSPHSPARQRPSLSQWLALIQLQTGHNIDVRWERFHYEPDGVLIEGEIPSYKALELLRQALIHSPAITKVKIKDAALLAKGKKVKFSLELS